MILDFLNKNSGALNFIATLISAIATIAYVLFTWKLVKESRRMIELQRENQIEPKIFVITQQSKKIRSGIDIVVQNIGVGPAYNVTFELEKNFEKSLLGKRLLEISLLRDGFEVFAHNQKMQFFFLRLDRDGINFYFEESSFKIKVTYQNSVGRYYYEEYLIDIHHVVDLINLKFKEEREALNLFR